MITDNELMFSEDQALTVTAVSTNVHDLGAAIDPASGETLELYIKVTAKGGTTPTINPVLQMDTTAAFASATTVHDFGVQSDPSIPLTLIHKLDPKKAGERYLRINYILAGTSPTFTVTAGITQGVATSEGN